MVNQITSGISFCLIFLFFFLSGPSLSEAGAASPAKGIDGPGLQTLADSPFQVRSWESDGLHVAEINGLVEYPFDRFSGVLSSSRSWCEFIPLVFNIKSCTYGEEDGRELLTFYVGRKFYEAPTDALRLQYRFEVREDTPNRSRIHLFAPNGPHGTRDYTIELEARPAPGGGSAIRLQASFRPSLRSKAATRIYLSTSGQDKVGFSIEGYEGGGPVYVGGVKGIIERNAMRYYLALQAFLDTLSLPEEKRFEARLDAWYRATEKYPKQLYEMDRGEYLNAKREERRHQMRLQGEIGTGSQADSGASRQPTG